MDSGSRAVVRSDRPLLQVVVDTEEEFDWHGPFRRDATHVTAMRHLGRLQRVFEEFGLRPCYVADYPVVTQPDGIEALRPLLESGRAEVGAHLHPWVTPPDLEEVCARNSYPGNLPVELERAKLVALREAIERNLGVRPTVYKAGRYGLGPNTYGLLRELGFQVDCSPSPPMDLREDGGPDFRGGAVQPYRVRGPADGASGGGAGLLVCPTTGGYAGALGRRGSGIEEWSRTAWGRRMRLGGVLSRLGVVERIRLSPEGYTVGECEALTRQLLREGVTIFSYTLHSPSAAPGHTPYVRDEKELDAFLDAMRRYFEFFFHKLDGRPTSPMALARDEDITEAANA